MITTRIKLDFFDQIIQGIRDDFERLIYPDGVGVADDDEITLKYRAGYRRPYASALMADVLTGRWNLGTSMVEVAENLGTDHPTISRALRWGELPVAIEGFLLDCPSRPNDLDEIIRPLSNLRHRSASIEVAIYLARKVPNRLWPVTLDEIHFEMLAAILERLPLWLQARKDRDVAMVDTVLRHIVLDSEIIPFWYTKKRQTNTLRLIKRLKGDVKFAFRYLCMLQVRWQGPVVLMVTATENLGWKGRFFSRQKP